MAERDKSISLRTTGQYQQLLKELSRRLHRSQTNVVEVALLKLDEVTDPAKTPTPPIDL